MQPAAELTSPLQRSAFTVSQSTIPLSENRMQPAPFSVSFRSRSLLWLSAVSLTLAAAGCGGHGSGPAPTIAQGSDIVEAGSQQGVTPFIRFVQFQGATVSRLASVHFVIAPQPGSASRPVDVRYMVGNLDRRGYIDIGSGALTLPVFGLYAGYQNHLTVELQFTDQSTQSFGISIAAAAYSDPEKTYDHPTIIRKRDVRNPLGFDFFAMKSQRGTPVIVDTDGALRWVGAGLNGAGSSAFVDNGFVIGDATSPQVSRLEFDGTLQQTALAGSRYARFHHNVDAGKTKLLGEVDVLTDGVENIESNAIEFDSSGRILAQWDLAKLISDYMHSQGDDPAPFVRDGTDWFHMNATTYDPRDDSLIVSSRENFVIKVDYTSGRILWIFGDPSKYWYTFPSLRAKALQLRAGDLYPIGQHATTLTSDGLLMLFNNGTPSTNQPRGTPRGDSRSYSAVSAYAIDPVHRTAEEVWRFDHGQTIASAYCSSAYESPGKSVLVSYALANGPAQARLVGLDASHRIVFEFQYPTVGCNTSWNAVPVPFEAMVLP
jgi:arylsulfate sulfotransferase